MTLTPPSRHRVGFLQTGGSGPPRAAPASPDRPGSGTCRVSSLSCLLHHRRDTTPTHSFIHPSHGTRPHSLIHSPVTRDTTPLTHSFITREPCSAIVQKGLKTKQGESCLQEAQSLLRSSFVPSPLDPPFPPSLWSECSLCVAGDAARLCKSHIQIQSCISEVQGRSPALSRVAALCDHGPPWTGGLPWLQFRGLRSPSLSS